MTFVVRAGVFIAVVVVVCPAEVVTAILVEPVVGLDVFAAIAPHLEPVVVDAAVVAV